MSLSMRKLSALLLAICLCLTVFMTACTQPATTEEAAPAEDAATEDTTEEATDAEPITLTILSSSQTEEHGHYELDMAAAYMEANPNVTIEFIPVASNELAAKIVQLATANDLPDAMITFPETLPVANDMGIIVDAAQYLDQEFLDSIVPSVYSDATTADGKLGLIPWFTVPSGLIYRTDWLEEAGIEEIVTMDDFLAAAQAFTTDDRWGFSMVGTNNASGTSRFTSFVRAYGVEPVYQDESGMWVSDLTTEEFKTALQDFVDLDLVHGVVPPGSTEAGYPEASNYFAQEQTGLMITGSNAYGVIVGTNPELEGKIGAVAIPMETQHASASGVSGYAITTACEHPEVMADYLKSMSDTENAVEFALGTGRLPATTVAAEAEELQLPIYQGFFDALNYAFPPSTFPDYSQITDIMGEAYNSMLSGASLDEAYARVESRVEEVLAGQN